KDGSCGLTSACPCSSAGAAVAVELRCQCIQHVSQVLPLKHIDSVTYYRPGPHCKAVEVIATMKSGLEHCLDPSAPWVKRMVKRILERYLRKCKEDRGMAQAAHGVA
uniref:C-X-C motif chemokine n=1 Tax=Salvator merianae TaxID=96440 RepID=A0A8D0DWA2_SALMN